MVDNTQLQWWIGNCTVQLQDGGLQAYLVVHNPPSDINVISVDNLNRYLQHVGISFGIIQENCLKIITQFQQFIGQPFLIAQGIPPQNGVDGSLQFHIDLSEQSYSPKIMEDGRVNYYEKGQVNVIQKGQLLVTRIPPILGRDGMSVTGTAIPAALPKDVRLPTGLGIFINEDQTKLFSACEGHVVYVSKDNRLNVVTQYEVKSDVDFTTGNIEYQGTVRIHGNVQTGFKVVASGDIEIDGYADGAYIEALGNVVIKSGIQGRNRGVIRAGKSVRTTFIQNASVFAGEDCIVQDSILHSQVNAVKTIRVEGKRAVIIGGVISAGIDVITNTLGSPMATPTEVEVGVHPELRRELQQIVSSLQELHQNRDKALKGIQILEQMAEARSLPSDKQVMYDNLKRTSVHVDQEIAQLQERKTNLDEQLTDFSSVCVRVNEIIHSGCKLILGQTMTFIKDDYRRMKFILDQGEIRMIPL